MIICFNEVQHGPAGDVIDTEDVMQDIPDPCDGCEGGIEKDGSPSCLRCKYRR